MNTTMLFSILLPTRQRPAILKRCLESIAATAASPEAIECVLYVDEDDDSSLDVDQPGLVLRRIVGEHRSMGAMHQACYRASRGRYVMLAGDDIIFRTPGWDEQVLCSFARFPDDVAMAYGNDLIQGRNMSTAPILSRTVCELLDGPCPAQYPSEFIDTHILDQFTKLRYWGYDRIIYLDHVVFEHMHYVVGKAPFDATYAVRPKTEDCRELFFSLDALRVDYARKIVRHLAALGAAKTQGETVFAEYPQGEGTWTANRD